MLGRHSVALAFSLVLVGACRPALPSEASPSASSIAGELVPSQEMSVVFHLPGAPSGLHAPFAFMTQEEALGAAGITVSIATPTYGVDPFTTGEDPTTVDLYIASPAAAVAAREAGADLVLVAGLERQSDWRLVTANASGITNPSDLVGQSIFVHGLPGDAAAILAALKETGLDPATVSLTYADDLSAPLDPTPILDGTYSAAIVSSLDGWPRLVQGPNPVSGASVGTTGLTELAVSSATSGIGLAIWAHASTISTDDAKIAAAASMIALAQGLAFCRDSIDDCAALFLGIGTSDQDQETVVWSVNALNGLLWPNADGVLSIDQTGLSVAVTQARDAGVLTSDFTTDYVDRSILDLAQAHWPTDLDRSGSNWTSLPVEIPLY